MFNKTDDSLRILFVSGLVVGIALVQTMTRYLRIRFGAEQWEPNFANVWRPLAKDLHNGAPLYLDGMGDNKPPLFELLNFALGGFQNHGLVFLFLVGVANGLVALLLWKHTSREYGNWCGLVSSGIWLLTLSYINGTHINVRSFALVGLLTSLIVRRPIWRGVAIGVAGLFSQYAVLFIPVLAWDSIRNLDTENRVRWLVSFGSGGLIVLLISFGTVSLLWGFRAGLAGLHWSYGIPTGVSTTGFATSPESYLTQPWIVTSPLRWGGYILHYGGLLSPVIFVSLVRGKRIVAARNWNVYFSGAFILLFPLLIRSYAAYWLLAWPFVITLAVIEMKEIQHS